MNWNLLTNEELARHADLAIDPLTTTELESVLIGRFTELVAEHSMSAALLEAVEKFTDISTTKGIEHIESALQFAEDYSLEQVRAVMEAALEHDVDTAEMLKPRLELADSIDDARDETLEALAQLTKIFNLTPTTTTN